MATAVKQNGRTSKGAAVPAKKDVDTSHYAGRIAARLRSLREAKGWTVADLAERLNRILPKEMRIANSSLHHWDSGGRNIDPDYYPYLAKLFGLSVRGFLPPE